MLVLGVYAQYTNVPNLGHNAIEIFVFDSGGVETDLQTALTDSYNGPPQISLSGFSYMEFFSSPYQLYSYTDCSQFTPNVWNSVSLNTIGIFNPEVWEIEALIIETTCSEANVWFEGTINTPSSLLDYNRVCNAPNNDASTSNVFVPIENTGSNIGQLHYRLQPTNCGSVLVHAEVVGVIYEVP